MADNKMKVSSANRDTKPVVQKSVELTGSALIDIRRGAWMLRNTENLNLPKPTSQYYGAYWRYWMNWRAGLKNHSNTARVFGKGLLLI